jgi:hypothetical protein
MLPKVVAQSLVENSSRVLNYIIWCDLAACIYDVLKKVCMVNQQKKDT